MKISKSQKIWFSVLGAGLCALVYDQCSGGATLGVDVGSIAAASPDPTDPRPAGERRPADPVTNIFNDRIAARLSALAKPAAPIANASAADTRDAFVPPAAWIAVGDSARMLPRERATKFEAAHELKAILQSGGRGQAMVDNRLITVGQSIDGFKLISIGTFRATFNDGVMPAVLVLKGVELSAIELSAAESRP